MLIYRYSPGHVPRTLSSILRRMKSITGQWLDKHATFRHESLERAVNVRSFPGPAALSGALANLESAFPCASFNVQKRFSGANFRKFKVALNPLRRIFLNFAESCILSC